MANGKKLKGGQASIWHGRIVLPSNNHDSMTRQRARRDRSQRKLSELGRDFGGVGPSGSHYWPEGMGRKIARAISRVA